MKPSEANGPNQLLIARLAESRWSATLERWLRAARPGGVLLDAPLPRTAEAAHDLLMNIAKAAPFVPFLAVCEEGGSHGALEAFSPRLPTPRAAANKSIAAVGRLGELIGDVLSLLGFNTNFAPVLDLATPFTEKTLGSRAFGADARQVAECGRAFVRGLGQYKILACAKHFPGWGSVPCESADTLPVSGKPMAALWREDLLPFRELLPQLPMVLISSAAYKAYDFDIPRAASLSAPIVEGLLRVKLGYRGLAVAYDLENENVPGALDLGEAALQSINAGCDLMVVDEGESFETIGQALQASLETRKLSAERLEESWQRIRAARKGLTPPKGRISKKAWDDLARRFETFSREFPHEELSIA